MDNGKDTPVWLQIAIGLVPLFIALVTGIFLILGNVKELQVEVAHLKADFRKSALDLHQDLITHSSRAAHGTVREDLAKHEIQIKALHPRLHSLERHAAQGERYTENDAREDRLKWRQQFETVLEEHKNFRVKLRRIEEKVFN